MNSQHRPILLIEDNPMDEDLTRRAFVRRKVINPIEVARDGEAALEYLNLWQAGRPLPVVILLDINLPKVNGLEVLSQFKSSPYAQKVPVIVLTSSAEDRDIQTAYKLGANSYIVKPVDFEKFLEVAGQIDLYWNVINIPPH
ncbi:MAG: two-component system response regulator [Chloroflexi bacterium RBG_16_57_11]|nr:MAG: two-component system response regulator [Chloroflexi bacterium RBG_16_57_11]